MNKFTKHSVAVVLAILLTGCVQYSLVSSNQLATPQSISVVPSGDWNKSPVKMGKKTEIWTRDGEALNQLIFVGGVNDGESLFKEMNKDIPMPTFSPDMLPNDIEDLVSTSIKNLANGTIEVNTSNLKPSQVGESFGFRFNFDFYTESGLYKKGDALAAIKDDQLYVIIFIATSLHYYDAYLPEINDIFEKAQI